jgi:hypothetical protein
VPGYGALILISALMQAAVNLEIEAEPVSLGKALVDTERRLDRIARNKVFGANAKRGVRRLSNKVGEVRERIRGVVPDSPSGKPPSSATTAPSLFMP